MRILHFFISFFMVVVALTNGGCGGRSGTALGGDGSVQQSSDTRSFSESGVNYTNLPPLAEFCTGSPKVVLNGVSLPIVKIQGGVTPMSCCDNALVRFITQAKTDHPASKAFEIVAKILIDLSSSTAPPQTFDLSHPPAGWNVFVDYYPCTPLHYCSTVGSLNTLENDLFSGTAFVESSSDKVRTVSLCLSAWENSPKSGSELHSVMLYAIDVPIGPLE